MTVRAQQPDLHENRYAADLLLTSALGVVPLAYRAPVGVLSRLSPPQTTTSGT